jgi:glutamate formiminotransferase
MQKALRDHGATIHFDEADEDHNRVVTAFSGTEAQVRETVMALAETALRRIDMRRHQGVHPRIGALDVCPFILLEGDLREALDFAADTAEELARMYSLPIFLYEHSETGKHEADLPSLRKGQFEGLLNRAIDADFGPALANPTLGATVLGVRDWLIAMNVNLRQDRLAEARAIAGEMRVQRDMGDARFSGVRALGMPLERQAMAQVSMNLTQPDNVSPDEIVQWIADREEVIETQLIGVIRDKDLLRATRLPVRPEQVVRAGN